MLNDIDSSNAFNDFKNLLGVPITESLRLPKLLEHTNFLELTNLLELWDILPRNGIVPR